MEILSREHGGGENLVAPLAMSAPLDRLAVSPQCGFGTTVGGAPMDEDTERCTLELVGRVAARDWN